MKNKRKWVQQWLSLGAVCVPHNCTLHLCVRLWDLGEVEASNILIMGGCRKAKKVGCCRTE